MAKTVARITSKIVEVTGNDATKTFVGRSVTRKNTKNGVVYTIGDTGYVLTSDEYKLFVAVGAIAQSSTSSKASQKTNTISKEAIKEAASKHKKSKDAEALVAASRESAPAADIDAIIADEKQSMEDETAEYSFNAQHQAILATSDFLQNYPTPEFKLDTPKRMGFFDRSADFSQKVTGFFDRVGRKGRDKIIDGMSD